jgi:Leucine-rich repeat (LRR) protein
MSEKQPNEPMSFSSFADWCRHIDSLSEEARHTVKVLLKKAGTDDPSSGADTFKHDRTGSGQQSNYRHQLLGSLTNLTTLNLNYNQITDISSSARSPI